MEKNIDISKNRDIWKKKNNNNTGQKYIYILVKKISEKIYSGKIYSEKIYSQKYIEGVEKKIDSEKKVLKK